ncbi:D-2-hydroxyacid dehydrogenase [Marinigracilibium pacificum]|uniref:D-2-hydroxyacid dehydrogenase n=1 Tax=Marinigracilibium pacificum TaxID=2729599 RepID=A0A848JB90_9BACT|nr:D-2-hydroxyacid dehydrogenase [Marinigracilibium pacificum]NMM50292.1 D-2-hydroxyacid dehydrogenase [Marinigracilibium pacificum]
MTNNLKIVVTDGRTLNPGDLSWDDWKNFGQIEVYDKLKDDQIIEKCKEANILVVNKTILNIDVLDNLPNLEFIAVTATGMNNIDLDHCQKKGIKVANTPGYGTFGVAQHSIALLLAITNKVAGHHLSVLRNEWANQDDFSYTIGTVTELKDKVMGIYGFGNIGKQTAKIAAALGMKVCYNSRIQKDSEFEFVSFDTLVKESDVISLHAPLTAENENIFNLEVFKKMKPTSLLINTARGSLINEKDLKQALEENIISGAALDVLQNEPPAKNHPILDLDNIIITPHMAWAAIESRKRIMEMSLKNLETYISGK